MTPHKDHFIDKALEMDEGFQSIYENIRVIIETQPDLYKEKLQLLKKAITEIGNLDVTITVQESRNKNLIELNVKTNKNKPLDSIVSKKTGANYYNNMNKQKRINPVSTFDSKK